MLAYDATTSLSEWYEFQRVPRREVANASRADGEVKLTKPSDVAGSSAEILTSEEEYAQPTLYSDAKSILRYRKS